MKSGVELGTEVLKVVVVMFRVLAHFLFLGLDRRNYDFWVLATKFLLLDKYVDLVNVSRLGVVLSGNVDFWSWCNESTNDKIFV